MWLGYSFDDYHYVTEEAKPYLAELIYRMSEDPISGTGIVAAHDHLLNQQMVGYLWENDIELNNIVDYFISNPQAYYVMYENFFREVKEHANVYVYDFPQGSLTSQEYQNPNTDDGVPDLVIAESHDRGGLALVIQYDNDTNKELVLRLACGFQPCNVVDAPVSPDPYNPPTEPTTAYNPPTQPYNPPTQPYNPPTQPEPTTEQPTTQQPTTEPPTTQPPTQPPTQPETTLHKDPADGTQGDIIGWQDPGVGEDTNNGPGAQYSTKDKPSDSNHMTQTEYQQTVGELESVNEAQKTGDNNNTPSYTPPEPVSVDNSGDAGNGGMPINNATPKDDKPAEIANDGNVDAWGGPPD